ncbi:MAG: metal-dependent transcriptional regulator [Nitrososphaeria archaeon]
MQVTKKERDYIVQIGQSADSFPLRLSELARSLGVSEPSAFEMVEKLKRAGLVKAKGGMIILTVDGQKFYSEIMMAHRTLETLMVRFGIDPDFACSECSKIDYLIDHKVIAKLFEWLNFPDLCPHGKPVKVI